MITDEIHSEDSSTAPLREQTPLQSIDSGRPG